MQQGFAALDAKLDKLEDRMDRGFAAVADDIDDVRRDLKGDIVRAQEHVGSIEAELRYGRYESVWATSKTKSSAPPANFVLGTTTLLR